MGGITAIPNKYNKHAGSCAIISKKNANKDGAGIVEEGLNARRVMGFL